MLEIIGIWYLSIAGLHAFVVGCMLLTGLEIDEIDNFWDFIIYNLLWIVQPIKSLIKFIKG